MTYKPNMAAESVEALKYMHPHVLHRLINEAGNVIDARMTFAKRRFAAIKDSA